MIQYPNNKKYIKDKDPPMDPEGDGTGWTISQDEELCEEYVHKWVVKEHGVLVKWGLTEEMAKQLVSLHGVSI